MSSEMTDAYWQPKYEAERQAKLAADRIAEDEGFAKAMAEISNHLNGNLDQHRYILYDI